MYVNNSEGNTAAKTVLERSSGRQHREMRIARIISFHGWSYALAVSTCSALLHLRTALLDWIALLQHRKAGTGPERLEDRGPLGEKLYKFLTGP
jgi:hypothetical protein